MGSRFDFLRFGVAVLLVLAKVGVEARAADVENFYRAPYLQQQTPHSIWVAWRNNGPITPVVRFGTSRAQLNSTVGSSNIVVRASLGAENQPMLDQWKALRTETNLALPKLHSAPIGNFQYEAKLTDLQPATRYYYAVFDGTKRLTPDDETYSFVTPPTPGARKPYRFWVIGDGGTGRKGQEDVHQAMLDYVRADKHPLDFWLHVGDMAYNTGRDVEFQSHFFRSYEETLRSSVCWAAIGNHEGFTSKGTTGVGPYFDAYILPKRAEAGGVASGTEAYYSFDHGNIHFICLDSHDLDRKPGGAMAKWLKADIEKAKADWLIAFWHHPPYTKGSHDSDKEKDLTEMREHIMPIIESGGVDLVLTGHSHIYERSMLMDGAYATPTVSENVILDDGDGDPAGDGAYRKSEGINPHEGLVEVVAGNAGQTLGRSGSSPVMKKIFVEHGSVIVDVDGDTLTSKMINGHGIVRDMFSIVKRGQVQQARLALPWQPPEYKKPETTISSPNAASLHYKILVPRNAEWSYMAGEHPAGPTWTYPDFDASQWKTGKAGFGFGDTTFQTELTGLRGKPSSVYLRREFNIPQADKITELGLEVNYTDAFICYLNGYEVARVGVGRSSGRNAQKIKAREGKGIVYIPLASAQRYALDGLNVIAIEAHAAEGRPDLGIDPALFLED
ncbi:MAG TPA: metallophosphoesterase family protein [Candidatus Limnocylindria bacterium]|jgi:hypothetical protein|nr:metallophosphoesterase family protein [Candidatus Limnocylindria bacterium]